MNAEPELVFHDTVPLPEKEIPKARETAKKQKEWVLMIFWHYPDIRFTPAMIHQTLIEMGRKLLLTSVRRCITDLTKEGRLIKCQYSESREGRYGKLNRTWKYRTGYITPITPKK